MALLTNKELKRKKLLDQGVLMLTDHRYQGNGLKEILETVNISKSSFYNYFGSKEH